MRLYLYREINKEGCPIKEQNVKSILFFSVPKSPSIHLDEDLVAKRTGFHGSKNYAVLKNGDDLTERTLKYCEHVTKKEGNKDLYDRAIYACKTRFTKAEIREAVMQKGKGLLNIMEALDTAFGDVKHLDFYTSDAPLQSQTFRM